MNHPSTSYFRMICAICGEAVTSEQALQFAVRVEGELLATCGAAHRAVAAEQPLRCASSTNTRLIG